MQVYFGQKRGFSGKRPRPRGIKTRIINKCRRIFYIIFIYFYRLSM